MDQQSPFKNLNTFADREIQRCYNKNENNISGFTECFHQIQNRLKILQEKFEGGYLYYNVRGQK